MSQINSIILVSFLFTILVSNSNAASFVTLKSSYNGKFVCAENNGNDFLVANREKAYLWETFKIIYNSDKTVSLRSQVNDRYVSNENAGNSSLIANSDSISEREKFKLITIPFTKRSAFQSITNGMFISVIDNNQIIANASTIGIRESFIKSANWVTLTSSYNGKYVSAEQAGNAPLIANREQANMWETFEIVYNRDGTVSFGSKVNGRYVCAENGSEGYLMANCNEIGPFSKFKVMTNSSTATSALQLISNGMYVTVVDNQLVANASQIEIEGLFQISTLVDNVEASENWVTLKSSYNIQYVSADSAGNAPLVANKSQTGLWEIFNIILNNDETVSLLSAGSAKYVCAENGGQDYLIANRNAPFEWEKFNLITDLSTNKSAFQSIVNGRFVSIASNGQLIANASTIGIQELFVLLPIDSGTPPPKTEYWALLRSRFSYKFLSANNNGNDPIVANSNLELSTKSQRFKIIYNYDNTISILADANSKYVCADNAAQDYLIAKSNTIGPWEKFYLDENRKFGEITYTLRSIVNGKYVLVSATNFQLIASSSTNWH